MKTNIHFWYLTDLFLEWEMFQTSCTESQNTHFIFNNSPPTQIILFMKQYRKI